MSWDAVDPSARTLGEPVRAELYARHRKAIKINEEIEPSLGWRPTLHFEQNKFSIMALDVRVSPFPESLMLTKMKIANAHLPITLYSICEESAYSSREGLKEAKELRSHGIGLWTVDADGIPTKQFGGIPIIQHIAAAEVDTLTKGLPKAIATKVKDAFDRYNDEPTSGVTAISDVIETLVYSAAKAAVRKGWLTKKESQESFAKAIDTMSGKKQFKNALAGLGSVRGFVKDYRNTANHSPRSRKQAYNKYSKCRQAFYAGIQTIESFHKAMKGIGLTSKV